VISVALDLKTVEATLHELTLENIICQGKSLCRWSHALLQIISVSTYTHKEKEGQF
jgi:hypothetical protein